MCAITRNRIESWIFWSCLARKRWGVACKSDIVHQWAVEEMVHVFRKQRPTREMALFPTRVDVTGGRKLLTEAHAVTQKEEFTQTAQSMVGALLHANASRFKLVIQRVRFRDFQM